MLLNKSILVVLAASLGTAMTFNINRLIAAPRIAQSTPPMGCMSGNSTHNHAQMMQSMRVNSEFDYLSKMIPHHQEAIATAKLLETGTQRPEMKQFARDIIRSQTAEIEQMQAWLKQWYGDRTTNVEYTPMMRDLTQLKGDALDRAFLEDMQMHHRSAVMMSHFLLNGNLATHPEVKTLAEGISTSQQKEIKEMAVWLQNWFGVTGMMGGQGGRGGMMCGGMMGFPGEDKSGLH